MQVYKPFPVVVMQEVPGELSLGFMCRGCRLGCPNCSYKSLRDWRELDLREYTQILDRYAGQATCVVFMGGDWIEELPLFLFEAQQRGYKRCLYTGLELADVNPAIVRELDFIKVGRWEGKKLGHPEGNQKFLNLRSGQDWTSRFCRPITDSQGL